MSHDLDQACTYSASGVPLNPNERHRRVHARRKIQEWAEANAASYGSYAEAHDACKFFLVGSIIGLVIDAVISWLVWRILQAWFPEQPEPAQE